MKILAKPSGITLTEHTKNVMNETQLLIDTHAFIIQKYESISNADLGNRMLVAARYHDEGKKHPIWQQACQKDFQDNTHGTNLLRTGIRHEIESLKIPRASEWSDYIKVAIAAHHGKLGFRFRHRWEDSEADKELWNNFYQLSTNVIWEKNLEASVLQNYIFSGPRAYLQLADRRASIMESGQTVPQFTKFDYQINNEWKLRAVQDLALKHSKEDLLLLRAPTGAGKTDAALLWAKSQIEQGKADRLLIAMPTRFTSNALAINISNSISERGLYHSSAWFTEFHTAVEEGSVQKNDAKLQHQFARMLATPITVCTIDHLLIALTHSREDHHTISFNLAHSCLVIDEADFYDEFTQGNLLELLRVLHILKVPVLLMSASLPQSSLTFFRKSGYSPKNIVEDTSKNYLIKCNIKSIQEYEALEDIDVLWKEIEKHPATIIYVNTVAKAVAIYQYLSERITDKTIILYHSRYTEPHKMEKERLLLKHLGKEAWESGKANGIAIMTQIGEMSVNISADFMVSEICPIDRLVQRVGRLSRFSETCGEVHVIVPQKNGALYPAPYGSFKKGIGWTPAQALADTLQLIECRNYTVKELTEAVDKIYSETISFSFDTEQNIKRFRDEIIRNWLIVPDHGVEEDSQSANLWRSRDIPSQIEVLVKEPKAMHFEDYTAFQNYKLQNAISCTSYLYENLKKKGSIGIREVDIFVKESKTKIIIVDDDRYNIETGLDMDVKDDNFL